MSELQKHELPKREPVPVPVTVKNEPIGVVPVPKLLDAVTSAGFVIVLVIFMLIEQRDLRNRLIRLTGHGWLAITTRALGDANDRITRYVLVQTMINLGYGLAIGLGLYVIGIPYVALWGFLAFALRFVPYIGTLMAALAPVAVSLAVFPGWPRPLLTVGLFVVVETLTYVVIEPLLYRQALGLSKDDPRDRGGRGDHVVGVPAVERDTSHLHAGLTGEEVAAAAGVAGAAVPGVPADPDSLSDLPAGRDISAYSINQADHLVPRYSRKCDPGPVAFLRQHVAVADAVRFDPHPHHARAGGRDLAFDHLQRTACPGNLDCSHLRHEASSRLPRGGRGILGAPEQRQTRRSAGGTLQH
jgi:hypothetical protein